MSMTTQSTRYTGNDFYLKLGNSAWNSFFFCYTIIDVYMLTVKLSTNILIEHTMDFN